MKQITVFRTPDVPESSGTNSPKRTTGLPQKDVDFMAVSRSVADTWTATPNITLEYMQPLIFDRMVTAYANILTKRINKGSNRPGVTQSLEQLDKQAETALKEVKVYIQKKFKKDNAEAQYPRYGIVKNNRAFKLPEDRNKRLSALQQMKDAIVADDFNAEEFGKAFWDDLYTAYEKALKAAGTTDGEVSTGVSEKNNLKDDIKKIMKSLRHVLEGNYPDTYKAEYRKWGWQKEDY